MRRAGLPIRLLAGVALAVAVYAWWPDRDEGEAPAIRTIVLLTPDTLRRDHVGAYAPSEAAEPHPATPHLDRLAARSLRFDDARSPVPLTLPAHTTMLTGLPPAVTGVRLNTYGRFPPPSARPFPLLQERLQAHGWHTAAFLSAGVLGRRYGLDQGFTHYDDGDLHDLTRNEVPERAGPATVQAALAHVRTLPADQRAFLWVHLFEPHAPYHRDGTYAGDVEALDDAIGTLLDGLAEAGRDRAVVLLAADHGEALGELGERTHGLLLADGVLRVPFLLSAPGQAPGVRTDPVGLEDVAPTLAALAQVPWEAVDGPGCGLDLTRGPLAPDRLRVAETLHGHHRFRWAQLVAAVSPAGTLVDAGRDRLHWIPPSGHRRILETTATAPHAPRTRDLGNFIAQYKRSEAVERMRQGQAAGGYGGGGHVLPFLPAEENARLPDPHTSIARAHRLDQVQLNVTRFAGSATGLRAQITALEAMNRPHLDAGNPTLHFLLGEAWMRLAALTGDASARAAAEGAYLEAFRLGRKDTETLSRACGVNAEGREEAMLEHLRTLGRQLPVRGCQAYVLEIRLLRALGRVEEAQAVCRSAQGAGACDNPRDRALWEKTCR